MVDENTDHGNDVMVKSSPARFSEKRTSCQKLLIKNGEQFSIIGTLIGHR